MEKAALIAEITAAFDGVSREDGVTLHQAVVLDDYGSVEEEEAARARDTEMRWQDVPEDDIRNTAAVLSFLDPKGFRYYLPAYMITYLKYVDQECSEAGAGYSAQAHSDDVRFDLGIGDTRPLDDYHRSRYAALSSEQSRAVAHFLIFLAEREEINTLWSEELRQTEIAEGKISQEESDAAEEAYRQSRLRYNHSDNEAQAALDRYWSQFL